MSITSCPAKLVHAIALALACFTYACDSSEPEYTGLWCGKRQEHVPSEHPCLLICDTDRAYFSWEYDEKDTKPQPHFYEYSYDGKQIYMQYANGDEDPPLGFVYEGDKGTIQPPPRGHAFDVERVAMTHELCTSKTAMQYAAPGS